MIVSLLITDYGTHSPEKLVGATIQRFLDDFRQNAPDAAYGEVMLFNDILQKALTGHHMMVQQAERSALATEGPQRLVAPLEIDEAVGDAVDHIMSAVTARTEDGKFILPDLRQYFQRPETRRYFEEVMRAEYAHSIWLERSWHAQGFTVRPDCSVVEDHPDIKEHPAAKAFMAHLQYGPALLARHDDELQELGGREMVSAIVSNSTAHLRRPDASAIEDREAGVQ